MKERIFYQAYEGNMPYIFLRFDKSDRQIASGIVNLLIDKQFRVCYDAHDSKSIGDSDWLASRIFSSQLTVFLISAGALKSMAFRNSINFALSKNKKVFCIYLDDEKLGYGFDMQLSHVPGIRLSDYKDTTALCEEILKTDIFVQDMRGEDAKVPARNERKKKTAVVLLASVLVLFLVAAAVITVYRINYENSLAGQIEKMSEADYLDISNEDAAIIELLQGKKIKTLVARNMELTDIEALVNVDCETLDISQNPHVKTLEPLVDNVYLKTVMVTQDMYPAIVRVGEDRQFKIVIGR